MTAAHGQRHFVPSPSLYKPAKQHFADALTARQFVRHNTRIAAPNLCADFPDISSYLCVRHARITPARDGSSSSKTLS
jgi:hypothetical protein